MDPVTKHCVLIEQTIGSNQEQARQQTKPAQFVNERERARQRNISVNEEPSPTASSQTNLSRLSLTALLKNEYSSTMREKEQHG